MQTGIVLLGTTLLLGLSNAALAQTPAPREGFQVDIRTGYSVAMGKLTADRALSDSTSGHVPFIVDVGGKPIPELFLGGYWGLGIGGAGGAAKTHCDADNAECTSASMHLGIQAQYQILPAGRINPWLGYGLGFESSTLGYSRNGATTTTNLTGFEFARLMAGAGFRLTRIFGVGPFVDLSVASFSTRDNGSVSDDIPRTGRHEWLTFGVRFVFFP
jgi:hypothetical protein